ncbi:CPBP family intramembrane glutamic endopeptidase [Oxalobacteraceae bacterium A2-2]
MKHQLPSCRRTDASCAVEELPPILIPGLKADPTIGKAAIVGALFCFFSVPLVIAYTLLESHFSPKESPIDPANWPLYAVLAIFLAPWLETAFFQRFVMEGIGYVSRIRRFMGVAISATLFAAGHLSYNAPLLHLVAGIMFSCIYLWSRGAGKGIATAATASAHLAHNTVLVVLVTWDPF